MAKWLHAHLPKDYTVLASPALRAQQTAAALGARVITDKTLAPGASPAAIARAAEKHKGTVVVVGHQPESWPRRGAIGRQRTRRVVDQERRDLVALGRAAGAHRGRALAGDAVAIR